MPFLLWQSSKVLFSLLYLKTLMHNPLLLLKYLLDLKNKRFGESEGKERYKAHSVTDPLLKNPQQAEWIEKFKHD